MVFDEGALILAHSKRCCTEALGQRISSTPWKLDSPESMDIIGGFAFLSLGNDLKRVHKNDVRTKQNSETVDKHIITRVYY